MARRRRGIDEIQGRYGKGEWWHILNEVIDLVASHYFFIILIIVVLMDTILGVLRAIEKHKFNSCDNYVIVILILRWEMAWFCMWMQKRRVVKWRVWYYRRKCCRWWCVQDGRYVLYRFGIKKKFWMNYDITRWMIKYVL